MRLAAALLLFVLLSTVRAAPPAPFPITVDSQTRSVPSLEVYQAEARTFRVTFKDGGAGSDVSAVTPFMWWATSAQASGFVTSSYASVASNIIDFTFSASAMNTNGDLVYGVGAGATYRQGTIRIIANPFATGIPAPAFSTNMNLAGYTFSNYPWLDDVEVVEGTSNGASVAGNTLTINVKTDYVAGAQADLSSLSNNLSAVTAAALTNESDTLGSVLARGNNANSGAITKLASISFSAPTYENTIDLENRATDETTVWGNWNSDKLDDFDSSYFRNLANGTNPPPAWLDSTNRVSSIVLNGATTTPVNGRADLGTITAPSLAALSNSIAVFTTGKQDVVSAILWSNSLSAQSLAIGAGASNLSTAIGTGNSNFTLSAWATASNALTIASGADTDTTARASIVTLGGQVTNNQVLGSNALATAQAAQVQASNITPTAWSTYRATQALNLGSNGVSYADWYGLLPRANGAAAATPGSLLLNSSAGQYDLFYRQTNGTDRQVWHAGNFNSLLYQTVAGYNTALTNTLFRRGGFALPAAPTDSGSPGQMFESNGWLYVWSALSNAWGRSQLNFVWP